MPDVEAGAGDNHARREQGKSIVYHNVVRRWVKVGDWNGAAATWTVPVADFKVSTIDQIAVIIQQGTAAAPGPVLAAALAPLD